MDTKNFWPASLYRADTMDWVMFAIGMLFLAGALVTLVAWAVRDRARMAELARRHEEASRQRRATVTQIRGRR